jgi:radical SAM protein with 4Fe4S-binding SPASM domain
LAKLVRRFRIVSIVTNGHLFENERLIKGVLDIGLPKINLSLDYISPTQYRSAKGGDLARLLEGIETFVSFRSQSKRKTFLQINYLYENSKDDYLRAFRLLDSLIKDRWCMYLTRIKSLAAQVPVPQDDEASLPAFDIPEWTAEKLLVEDWNRYLGHTNFRTDRPQICRHIHRYFVLRHNGDIVPCFNDQHSRMVICNVPSSDVSLADVFQSEVYRRFRHGHQRLEHPICRDCRDYYKYT